MPNYMVANITIHDRERYAQYGAGFMEIFKRFNGKMLAVDEEQEVLEGDYSCTRTVLIEFPSHEDAKAWYESAAYHELAKHRWASSDGNLVLIKGLGT